MSQALQGDKPQPQNLNTLEASVMTTFLSLLSYPDAQLQLLTYNFHYPNSVYSDCLRQAFVIIGDAITFETNAYGAERPLVVRNAESVAQRFPHAVQMLSDVARVMWSGSPLSDYVPTEAAITKLLSNRVLETT